MDAVVDLNQMTIRGFNISHIAEPRLSPRGCFDLQACGGKPSTETPHVLQRNHQHRFASRTRLVWHHVAAKQLGHGGSRDERKRAAVAQISEGCIGEVHFESKVIPLERHRPLHIRDDQPRLHSFDHGHGDAALSIGNLHKDFGLKPDAKQSQWERLASLPTQQSKINNQ